MFGVPAAERVFWRSRCCTIWVSYDVVDVLCAHADEIMARGERSWLDDQGIERDFSSY
jgi:hypothetical protein